MSGSERDAGRPGIPDDDDRIAVLASALRSCLTRLDDLGEGDGPTAKAARAALRRAGL
jgi:hypothetical protein